MINREEILIMMGEKIDPSKTIDWIENRIVKEAKRGKHELTYILNPQLFYKERDMDGIALYFRKMDFKVECVPTPDGLKELRISW